MRFRLLPLVALLAFGCGHASPPPPTSRLADDPFPRADDEHIPIRTADDVVGWYRSVLGDGELIWIDVSAGALTLWSDGQPYPLTISPDGRLLGFGQVGATLVRRGDRRELQIGWCYQYRIYELERG